MNYEFKLRIERDRIHHSEAVRNNQISLTTLAA